jgi:hypothetical protein
MLKRLPVLLTPKRLYHHQECNLIQSYVRLGFHGDVHSRLARLKDDREPVNKVNVQHLINSLSETKAMHFRLSLCSGILGFVIGTDTLLVSTMVLFYSAFQGIDGFHVRKIVEVLEDVRNDDKLPVLDDDYMKR